MGALGSEPLIKFPRGTGGWHALPHLRDRREIFQVDILPGRATIQVTCLPKTLENVWNCCRALSTC
jgi:hypothetical protein